MIDGPAALLTPGGLLDPGAKRAQDERCAGVGKRVMSTPTSAMITAAAVAPIPGISSTSSALPISRAAIRYMIACSSCVCSNTASSLVEMISNRRWLPAGAAGTVTNLVRVLEATLKGPQAQLPVPD